MTSAVPETPPGPPVGQRTVRRITFLIPGFGIAAGLAALVFRRADWAEGLIFGSVLAWLNFWWMKRAVQAFAASSSKGESRGERPKGQAATFLAVAFRYALIGFALYGIFILLHVPLLSIVIGLCAFAAATITASVWEILQSVKLRS
jgi:ATP synthase I chain